MAPVACQCQGLPRGSDTHRRPHPSQHHCGLGAVNASTELNTQAQGDAKQPGQQSAEPEFERRGFILEHHTVT